jgi:hypothetical protein
MFIRFLEMSLLERFDRATRLLAGPGRHERVSGTGRVKVDCHRITLQRYVQFDVVHIPRNFHALMDGQVPDRADLQIIFAEMQA